MMKYVVGFMFDKDLVLLVNKSRPNWQERLWNGVGGKIEDNEVPLEAMRREFKEEIGCEYNDWDLFAIESGRDYMVYCFRADVANPAGMHVRVPLTNDVGEYLGWLPITLANEKVIGNLHWLVPMAYDWRRLVAKIDVYDDIKGRPTW